MTFTRHSRIGWTVCLLAAASALSLGATPPARVATDAIRELQLSVDVTFAFTPGELRCRTGEPTRIVIVHATPANGPDLPHTAVLLQAAADVETYSKAALEARLEDHYVPREFQPQVIAATGLIHAGGRTELRFTAPSAPGRYPIVCSFPGHCLMGMRAVLIVE